MQYVEWLIELEFLAVPLWLIIGWLLHHFVGEKWHEKKAARVFHHVLKEVGTDIASDYPLLEAFLKKFKAEVGRDPKASELNTARSLREDVLGE